MNGTCSTLTTTQHTTESGEYGNKKSDEMISILYLIDVLENVGGAERHLMELVRRLDKAKYRPLVCCLGRRGAFARLMENERIPLMVLSVKRIYDFYGIKQAFFLFRFLKKENIKIIQTFDFGSDILGPVVGRLAGVPIIISSRRDMGFLRKRIHILVLRIINLMVDKIMVVSNAVGFSVRNREKVKSDKIVTIHNGVDLAKFSRNGLNREEKKCALGIKLSAPVVGTIGRLREEKGHIYFLELARLVLKVVPEVQFLIVGDGPLRRELEAKTEELGLQNNVIFTGERGDIPEILSVMDVFVLPSLTEGFSNVLLEAMAMEVPVVATRVGGNPEVIINGDNGFLCETADYRKMAECVANLLVDKDLADRIGRAGRRHVESEFDTNVMVGKIEGLYQQLIEEKGLHLS